MRAALGPALATVLVAGVFAHQAQPAQTPVAPRPANGLILGQVVDAGTGRPVRGALVTVTGGGAGRAGVAPTVAEMQAAAEMAARLGVEGGVAGGGPGQPRRVLTDRDGRFVFRDLAPGIYNAAVTLTGYASGAFGRRRPDGPPRPIDLGENERVLDATIRLWKLASIAGTVVDEAGEPIVGLQLRVLRRTTTGGRRRFVISNNTQTDDRGMYRLASLMPGDYVVAIPSTVTSVPASSVAEYMDAMSSGSAASMSSVNQRRMDSGAPSPSSGGITVGDQQLQLNMSPISGGGSNVLPPTADGRIFVYRTTFYPAAASASQASVVTLGSGDARTGVDLTLKPVPTVRVSGTITSSDGPVAGVGVRLVPADSEDLSTESGFEAALSMTDASGRFTMLGVPAGQYLAKAYRVPRPQFMPSESMSIVGGVISEPSIVMPPTAAAGPSFWAETPVAVGDSDVTDVSLAFRSGIRVSGHLEFEGTAARPAGQRMQQLTVALQLAEGRPPSPAFNAPTRPDAEGRFATGGLAPGRYWINVPPPGPEWSIKSIQAGSTNALDRPVDLTSADLSGVVITFSDRVAELSGTVQGATADDDVAVLVFPADFQSWFANGRSPRRTVTTFARQNGSYSVRLPPAGEYLVVALLNESAPDGDAAFYASIARLATRLSVAEGDRKSLPLTASRVR